MRADSGEDRTARDGFQRLTLAVVLAISYVAALGTVALLVQHYSGLTWGAVLQVLLGLSP